MKAKVVGIESASRFSDGKRRLTLRITGADHGYSEIRVTDEAIGFVGLALDMELEVDFYLRPATLGSDAKALAEDFEFHADAEGKSVRRG